MVELKTVSANPDLATKLVMAENFLWIIDKDAILRQLHWNYPQRLLFSKWSRRMILLKSRQQGLSTAILALFFIEAQIIPGLVIAIVSHEDYATRRLLDKIDTFHHNLPPEMKSKLYHDSDNEKVFENGSTIYIGTAGQRAFGRGDTIHRALVSEESHYPDAEKLLSGLAEAVPISGYLIRESTPCGDEGYFRNSVKACIAGKSDYTMVPFYWWYLPEYRLQRDDSSVIEADRGELSYTPREIELMLEKGLDEEQIRWRRWKIRSMVSEEKGNLFPQEYIEDLESCWLGPKDKVFADVVEQLQSWSLRAREPIRQEGILEIWKEPELGARYIFWVDPCGGESPTDNDPHDGVILKVHSGGLEHIASIESRMEQKPLAYKVAEIGAKYNYALLIVERNGVGKGVLNYLVSDIGYKNLYQERAANGELTGKWGFYTDHSNKAKMVSDAISAIKNNSVISYDRKLISQLLSLVNKDGKIAAKKPSHDDRAIAFCGAISVSPQHYAPSLVIAHDYVTF